MADLTYWVIEVGNDPGNYGWFRVTPETARHIRDFIEEGIVENISFTDNVGSECFYPTSGFKGMYESTPEIRRLARNHQKLLEAEEAEDGIPGLE